MTTAAAPELFRFDNTYARELTGCYAAVTPATVPAPELLRLNDALARELGVDVAALDPALAAAVFAGNVVPAGATPIAQAYAGHQFGGFTPQLGDGRAVLLGEVIDRHGRRRDIALKGSGRTPFSRGGDGKAAVGPVLREYLMGEAMHALGIPTTRTLAAVRSGEVVWRDQPLPGALLTRVASSHVRVGTFQFFAARGAHDTVRALADYVIARHDPDLTADPDRYLGLVRRVASRQAAIIATALVFALVHLPNPLLMIVTFVGAVAWCACFDRYPNVLPLAVSHALGTLAMLYAFNDTITGRLRIGASYLRLVRPS